MPDSNSTPGQAIGVRHRGGGFVVVPKWVHGLGWKATLAYNALAAVVPNGADELHNASHASLAERMGVGVSTMRDGIRALIDGGAIEVRPEYHPATGSRLANVYVLGADPPVATRQGPPVATGGEALLPGNELVPPNTRPQDVAPAVPHAAMPARPEVAELCALLATHVGAVTGATPAVSKAWLRDMRLMLDRPRAPGSEPWSAEQVEYVIGWLGRAGERSQFWSVNVRCPSKLRAQMDRLVLEIRSERRGPSQQARAERIRNVDPATIPSGDPFTRALARARGAELAS